MVGASGWPRALEPIAVTSLQRLKLVSKLLPNKALHVDDLIIHNRRASAFFSITTSAFENRHHVAKQIATGSGAEFKCADLCIQRKIMLFL